VVAAAAAVFRGSISSRLNLKQQNQQLGNMGCLRGTSILAMMHWFLIAG
jgi:hypothetical protein